MPDDGERARARSAGHSRTVIADPTAMAAGRPRLADQHGAVAEVGERAGRDHRGRRPSGDGSRGRRRSRSPGRRRPDAPRSGPGRPSRRRAPARCVPATGRERLAEGVADDVVADEVLGRSSCRRWPSPRRRGSTSCRPGPARSSAPTRWPSYAAGCAGRSARRGCRRRRTRRRTASRARARSGRPSTGLRSGDAEQDREDRRRRPSSRTCGTTPNRPASVAADAGDEQHDARARTAAPERRLRQRDVVAQRLRPARSGRYGAPAGRRRPS